MASTPTPHLENALLEELVAQVDTQLGELRRIGSDRHRGSTDEHEVVVPEAQIRVVERVTGEARGSFLERFRAAGRRDLCQEGGILYDQWRQFRDISTHDTVKVVHGVLLGMGMSGHWQTLVVPLAVIIIHVGVRAICEGDTPGR
jgi:hypothetical protein